MSRTRTWLLRICAVGLVLLLQGPAILTQEIAWAGMLVSYTRDRGLARGVVETFDGNHPCAMCAKAEKLRTDETGNPAEPGREKSAPKRLAWAEMVPPKWLCWKAPSAVEVCAMKPVGPPAIVGRGREAPVPPPPRRA